MSSTAKNTVDQSVFKVKQYYNDGMAVVVTNPKYYALACLIEMVIMILIIYKWSPFEISQNYPVLVNLFILMFGFMQMMSYFFVKNRHVLKENGIEVNPTLSDLFIKVIFTVVSVCACVAVMYALLWGLTHFPSIQNIFTFTVDLLIVCGVLSVLYLIFLPAINTANSKEGRSSLLTLMGAFIMYFPCAMIDIIDWFKHQYSITTKTVWIILAAEAFFIAIRFILPKVLTLFLNMNGEHLLRDPVYLSKETTLGSYETLHESDDKRRYHYSISAWFWINPQPPNTRAAYTKYTNILEFGGKPALEYNGIEDTLRVTCNIKDDENVVIYKTDEIPFQRWNNIVINYDGGNMDVFMNGQLVGSRPGVAPYMTYENIVVGEEKGIEGGICNVVYYKDILQARQIDNIYRALGNMPNPVL
jgi:hypothetical protein